MWFFLWESERRQMRQFFRQTRRSLLVALGEAVCFSVHPPSHVPAGWENRLEFGFALFAGFAFLNFWIYSGAQDFYNSQRRYRD